MPNSSPSAQLDELTIDAGSRIEELSSASEDSDAEFEDESDSEETISNRSIPSQAFSVPSVYTQLPFLRDGHFSGSSETQAKTAGLVRELMSGGKKEVKELNSHRIPRLLRKKHIRFMEGHLGQLPAPFQAMDAGRPWMLYWGLSGLAALGQDVTEEKDR